MAIMAAAVVTMTAVIIEAEIAAITMEVIAAADGAIAIREFLSGLRREGSAQAILMVRATVSDG